MDMHTAPGMSTLDRDTDGFTKQKILRFSEISDERKNPLNAHMWFIHKIKVGKEPIEACYQEIPVELRSLQLMFCAADKTGINVLQGLDWRTSPDYISIAQAVTAKYHKQLAFVPPEVRSLILPGFCMTHIHRISIVAKDLDWLRAEMPQDVFERCCVDTRFALDSPIERVPVSVLQKMMTSNYYDAYSRLRKKGLLSVMADRIVAGDWQDKGFSIATTAFKPASLEDGIQKLKETKPGSDHETLYMAYAMTYPMDQVVSAMRGKRLVALLVEMYTVEALKPFMRVDRELSGLLLEDGLGL